MASMAGMSSKEIWEELGYVDVDYDDCIMWDFYHFKKGTHREDIWQHLEDRDHTFSVAKEMGYEEDET